VDVRSWLLVTIVAATLYTLISVALWMMFPSARIVLVLGWLIIGAYCVWVAWYTNRHGQT
jgi:hypothetical protein